MGYRLATKRKPVPSKGLSFLKFGAILNIVMGAILILPLLALGIFEAMHYTSSFQVLIDFVSDLGSRINKELPNSWIDWLITTEATEILMGVSFGLVLYIIVVQFVLSCLLLKKIKRARLRQQNFSRGYALLVSFLSIIPAAVGLIMIFGSFGKKPVAKRIRRGRPRQNVRRGRSRRMVNGRPYYY